MSGLGFGVEFDYVLQTVYNGFVPIPRHLPRLDRISILAAAILLAYIAARFIPFPAQEVSFGFLGVYLSFSFNISVVIAIFVVGLTGTGVDWLLQEHPALEGGRTIQHWMLPTLTAWTIGAALAQLPLGTLWWPGVVLGSSFLIFVVLAEYITVDPQDGRRIFASMGLTAVAFSLFLVLAVALRTQEIRLFLMVPAMAMAIGLISLRVLHLRLQGRWAPAPAVVVMMVTGQVAAALHYLPLPPTGFALALVGIAYAVTTLAASILEGRSWGQLLIEPLFVFVLTWGIAVVMLG